MENNILEGEVQTPVYQRQKVFTDKESSSAYEQAILWLDAFRPTQVQIVYGTTQEGTGAVSLVYIR